MPGFLKLSSIKLKFKSRKKKSYMKKMKNNVKILLKARILLKKLATVL